MGRIRRGGYIIEWWIGDHYPKHVHVFKDGREIAKVRVPGLIILSGTLNKRLVKILKELIEDREI